MFACSSNENSKIYISYVSRFKRILFVVNKWIVTRQWTHVKTKTQKTSSFKHLLLSLWLIKKHKQRDELTHDPIHEAYIAFQFNRQLNTFFVIYVCLYSRTLDSISKAVRTKGIGKIIWRRCTYTNKKASNVFSWNRFIFFSFFMTSWIRKIKLSIGHHQLYRIQGGCC